MSDFSGYKRKRGRTLLIVEGAHEKNELFHTLFKAFPELNISQEDVWIYGTNIYKLFKTIVREYGEGWEEDDIDLPFLISSRKEWDKCYKNDFTNIFLVFDYERHAPDFEEDKIIMLQRYFSDSADMGKLYINYPMLESYQDIESEADPAYLRKSISVQLQPGSEYKKMVKNSFVKKAVSHVDDLCCTLIKIYGVQEKDSLEKAVEGILKLEDCSCMEETLNEILSGVVGETKRAEAVKHVQSKIMEIGYLQEGTDYWHYIRRVFRNMILLNIQKALWIQNETFSDPLSEQDYGKRDDLKILNNQNEAGRNEAEGKIWVLNTCVFLVPDYNYALLN